MKRLHKISTKKLLKFLHTKGFRCWAKKGSHIILIQANTAKQLQIPYRKELGQKTLQNSLNKAGYSMKEFLAKTNLNAVNYMKRGKRV